jgi:tetraacyldisaccharide 4'-kinase
MKPPHFWYQEPVTLMDQLVALLTRPLAPVYAARVAARIRNSEPAKVDAAIICVGNLTMGGTGKTPVTRALIEMLTEAGTKAHALSRGYGGSVKGPICVDLSRHTAKDVGDEPLILAQAAPVWISRNRLYGASAAILHEAQAIVMDDGHQNPQLHKDLSVVVMDAEAGWGNERVFPAGPLREPVTEGLSRAHAIILMMPTPDYEPDYDALGLTDIELPVLKAWLEPVAPPPDGPLLAFAGIGRPEKFFKALANEGGQLAGTKAYPDHHDFSRNDLRQLKSMASTAGAQLITTEKDWVRIPAAERDGLLSWPVRAKFAEPARAAALLAQALDAAAARR